MCVPFGLVLICFSYLVICPILVSVLQEDFLSNEEVPVERNGLVMGLSRGDVLFTKTVPLPSWLPVGNGTARPATRRMVYFIFLDIWLGVGGREQVPHRSAEQLLLETAE